MGNTLNVYVEPLGGGPPVRLTHFDSESAQVKPVPGRRTARSSPSRARYSDSDVVMFTGFG